MAPAGQFWSTATDMAKWAAFLTDPAPAVLARETVDEMCTPVVIHDLESWTGGHGLGPQLFRVGERVYVGHGGSMPGYLAHLSVHRKSRLGVVVFANSYSLTGTSIKEVGLAALDAVVGAEPAARAMWQPPVPAEGEAAEICGRWWWMGREYEVTADGDAVEMTADGHGSRFVREAPDRWRGVDGDNEGEILAVLRDPETGQVDKIDVATFVFSRDPRHLA
jgi:CubicO group peptidase (beta-lactamase class C family)